MLIQLLIDHPEAALAIVQRTPPWVWGLAAGLLALGLSQRRDRHIGWHRACLPALGLTAFSIVSLLGDLRHSAWALPALATWLATASQVLWRGARRPQPAGTTYNPTTRRFIVPGSTGALWTVLGLFMLKYAVGVELALQPDLIHSPGFCFALAAVYGLFSGGFSLRPLALWRLAHHTQAF